MKKLILLASVATTIFCFSISAPAISQESIYKKPTLDDFTAQPVFSKVSMSKDGKWIVGVRRVPKSDKLPEGDALVALNVDTKELRQISFAREDQHMKVSAVQFKGLDTIIFRVSQKIEVVAGTGTMFKSSTRQDNAFVEVSRIWAVGVDGKNMRQVFDPQTLSNDYPKWMPTNIASSLPNDPDNILITIPGRAGRELAKVNIKNGALKVIERGILDTMSWVVNKEGVPVLRQDVLNDGEGFIWSRRPLGSSKWIEIARFKGAKGANSGVDFQGISASENANEVIVRARKEGSDTTGAYVYNVDTGTYVKEIGTSERYDIDEVMYDVETGAANGYCYNAVKRRCESSNPQTDSIYNGLVKAFDEDNSIYIIRDSEQGKRMLVRTIGPKDLGTYYLYNKEQKSLDFIGGTRPDVAPDLLPSKEIFNYTAADGTPLWGYLWVPPGADKNTKSLPFIVLPHGGPEGRDIWDYDPFASYWATEGYMVLQPNFRGGGGQGRKFVEKGWRQWGQLMQKDVRDGAEAVIKTGRADKNKICIAGWSYGGYATMTGSFVDGDLYKCAVAGAGVSDLIAMQEWERFGEKVPDVVGTGGASGYKSISYQYWKTAIGDPVAEKDMLIKYSAARNADKVNIPLLLIHGDEDDVVPISQSELMQKAMEKEGKKVDLIRLPDAGHQWSPMTEENRKTVLTKSLEFFQKYIGPGYKPK